jgi:hypothetical protein
LTVAPTLKLAKPAVVSKVDLNPLQYELYQPLASTAVVRTPVKLFYAPVETYVPVVIVAAAVLPLLRTSKSFVVVVMLNWYDGTLVALCVDVQT